MSKHVESTNTAKRSMLSKDKGTEPPFTGEYTDKTDGDCIFANSAMQPLYQLRAQVSLPLRLAEF